MVYLVATDLSFEANRRTFFVFQVVLSHYHPIFRFLQIVTMFQTREMRPWNHKSPLAVLHHMLEITCTCLSEHHMCCFAQSEVFESLLSYYSFGC
jgi:hypothetical protein